MSKRTLARMEEKPIIEKEEMLSLLECPVCKDVLSAPVYICDNGHSLCGVCKGSMTLCGLCRSKITAIRNFALEKILEKVFVQCPFASEGCPRRLSASRLKAHEAVCNYRQVVCTLKTSSKNCGHLPVNYSQYFDHISKTHKLASMESDDAGDSRFRVHFYDENIFSCDVGFWPSVYYSYDNRIFIVRSVLAKGIFSAWSSVIGTRADAAKYKINLTLLHHFQNLPSSSKATTTVVANKNPSLMSCGCACRYTGEVKVAKEWKGCSVFTQHVQSHLDVEEGASPFRIPVEDLPAGKVKISLSSKRKRDDEDGPPPSQLMHSWSVVFNTVKVEQPGLIEID